MNTAWWWSWLLTVVGITGFYFTGKKVWWGWYINIACQVLWFSYALITHQYGFLWGSLFYLAMFSKNAYEWTKEHRGGFYLEDRLWSWWHRRHSTIMISHGALVGSDERPMLECELGHTHFAKFHLGLWKGLTEVDKDPPWDFNEVAMSPYTDRGPHPEFNFNFNRPAFVDTMALVGAATRRIPLKIAQDPKAHEKYCTQSEGGWLGDMAGPNGRGGITVWGRAGDVRLCVHDKIMIGYDVPGHVPCYWQNLSWFFHPIKYRKARNVFNQRLTRRIDALIADPGEEPSGQ